MIIELLNNIWLVFLDTAFWLLVGLLAAGVIKSTISEATMKRWIGGRGFGSILRAALVGAPLPLCSCGVLPAAIGLHRSGASKEATVSFLISTPETSIDSVTVTYALMGPVMAVVRPVAALVNAVSTGLLTAIVSADSNNQLPEQSVESCGSGSCCSRSETVETVEVGCCSTKSRNSGDSCCTADTPENRGKLMQALSYAGAELLDDISGWLVIGIVFAGTMLTFIPPDWLSQWGTGLVAMLVMLVVGIPMYICAVASTPVAAGLLLAGVSPGAVLVFLLVGPATNITSFALLKRELGFKVTAVYLLGLSVSSLLMGLVLEWLLITRHWQINAQLGDAHAILPEGLVWGSALLLIVLMLKPVRRRLLPQLG